MRGLMMTAITITEALASDERLRGIYLDVPQAGRYYASREAVERIAMTLVLWLRDLPSEKWWDKVVL